MNQFIALFFFGLSGVQALIAKVMILSFIGTIIGIIAGGIFKPKTAKTCLIVSIVIPVLIFCFLLFLAAMDIPRGRAKIVIGLPGLLLIGGFIYLMMKRKVQSEVDSEFEIIANPKENPVENNTTIPTISDTGFICPACSFENDIADETCKGCGLRIK